MRQSRVWLAVAAVTMIAAGARGAEAQMTPSSHPEQPAMYVSADAEVKVAPDRAHLSIAVETRGRTSQLAGSENARIQTAVLDALRRQGIESSQLQTRALQVTPEYQYPRDGGRPTVTGYTARNEVVVEVRDLQKIGAVIDAALAQGATNVAGPRFSLASPDSARREALDIAVRKAMADARVIAAAAGVRVGRILELTSESMGGPQMPELAMMRVGAADAAQTPVETGLISVRASVRVKVALNP